MSVLKSLLNILLFSIYLTFLMFKIILRSFISPQNVIAKNRIKTGFMVWKTRIRILMLKLVVAVRDQG